MGGTRCKIKEEGGVRRQGVVVGQPVNSFVSQILGKVVALFGRGWLIDRIPVFIQGGIPLVGFATDEALEIVEAEVIRPAGERT